MNALIAREKLFEVSVCNLRLAFKRVTTNLAYLFQKIKENCFLTTFIFLTTFCSIAEQRSFIASGVKAESIELLRTKNRHSRRRFTNKYSFLVNGQRIKVCRDFLWQL